MKKQQLIWLLLSFMIICLPMMLKAQDHERVISKIETIDGNEYLGTIIELTKDTIKLRTDVLGMIAIPVNRIKKTTEMTQVQSKDGLYWTVNPQATRYFWVPNAYNLKKGEGYYQNVWVMFNQAIYGISDHVSLGFGTMPLFLFGTPTPVWLTAKFSVPIVENKFNVGGGALIGTVLGEDGIGFGILYGITTFGSKDKNLNFGMGWAYAGGEMAKYPTFNLSAMIRTGSKGYFITENYLISGPEQTAVMMMVGGRRIIKKVGLDFGGVIPVNADIDRFVIIPWLGFTMPF